MVRVPPGERYRSERTRRICGAGAGRFGDTSAGGCGTEFRVLGDRLDSGALAGAKGADTPVAEVDGPLAAGLAVAAGTPGSATGAVATGKEDAADASCGGTTVAGGPGNANSTVRTVGSVLTPAGIDIGAVLTPAGIVIGISAACWRLPRADATRGETQLGISDGSLALGEKCCCGKACWPISPLLAVLLPIFEGRVNEP